MTSAIRIAVVCLLAFSLSAPAMAQENSEGVQTTVYGRNWSNMVDYVWSYTAVKGYEHMVGGQEYEVFAGKGAVLIYTYENEEKGVTITGSAYPDPVNEFAFIDPLATFAHAPQITDGMVRLDLEDVMAKLKKQETRSCPCD